MMESNSQVSFMDGQFRIIHIPLSLYKSLLQPILSIVLPRSSEASCSTVPSFQSTDEKHEFLNISITPSECTVICHNRWATTLFEPAFAALPQTLQAQVDISLDLYSVFSVSSISTEAGSRVLELTSPLALANVPIFFITTYYTDFIVIPTRDYQVAVDILVAKGFEFSEQFSAFIVPSHRRDIPLRGRTLPNEPVSTLPTDFSGLQKQTFAELRKQGVVPFVVPELQVVQCSIRDTEDNGYMQNYSTTEKRQTHWTDNLNANLWLTLVSMLVAQPRFLSLTMAKDHPLTFLLDKELLHEFGDMLAGDTSCVLVPIFLDLSNLTLQSTGIVCGVAGTLVADVEEQRKLGSTLDISELSYLSTARAGTVILSEVGCERAMEVLLPLLPSPEAS